MSILKKIFDCLKEVEDTFLPGTHEGDCVNPYYVVKMSGSQDQLTVSSERPVYEILCYVPPRQYTYLENMIYNAKQKMKEIYPLVMYAGNETEPFFDENVNGWMVSFQYLGCRKLENYF